MRGEEHGAALVHERAQQRSHLEDPRRVEPVGGLVQDQQVGIDHQAPGDPQPLAHPHRVPRHALVRAVGETDPLERRGDPVVRLALAARCDDVQVLPAGQLGVEARLLDDRADPRERGRPLDGERPSEQPHRA